MKARNAALLLAAAAVLAGAIFVAWWIRCRGGQGRETGVAGEGSARPGAGATATRGRRTAGGPEGPAEAGAARTRELLSGLTGAVESGERARLLAEARTLRTALLADPSLIAAAAASLKDPDSSPALRQALAVVLGSLTDPAGKRSVLEALREGSFEGIETTALLVLGMAEPDDEEAFERDGEPYAVEAAPGLTVLVRGPLEAAEAREEAAAWLEEGASPEERLAAARVLHDSTSFPEVRQALLDRIGRDPDGEVTAEAAASLAEWTREAATAEAERGVVLGRLFDAVPEAEEVVRLRLAGPLSSTALGPEQQERLASLAAAPQPEARRFALEVLGRKLDPRRPEGDAALVSVLTGAALADPSPEAREAAAISLGRVARLPRVAEALATLLQKDPDWEVRSAAARSLAWAAPGEPARSALAGAAGSDPDPLVRAAAQEALEILEQASGR